MKSSFSNVLGMTLIEVMVGTAVFTISAVIVLWSTYFSDQVNRRANLRGALNISVTALRDRVRYSNLCTDSFQALNVGFDPTGAIPADHVMNLTLDIPDIRAGEAEGAANLISTAAPNNTLFDNNFVVENLELNNWSFIPGTDNGSTRDYFAVFRVRVASPAGPAVLGGAVIVDRTLGGIILRVDDATRQIVECEGSTINTINEICTSFGCTYDVTATPPCNCDRPPIGCPAGHLPVAVQDNIFECKAWGGTCPAGQLLVGAGIEDVTCAPPPVAGADCTIPAGTTWTVGVETCTSDADVVIADGGSGSIVDSSDPATGTRPFSCAAGVASPTGAGTCAEAVDCPPGGTGSLAVSETECPGDTCEVEVVATTGPLAGIADITYSTDDIAAAFFNNACAEFEDEYGVTTDTTANPCTTYTCPGAPPPVCAGGPFTTLDPTCCGAVTPTNAQGVRALCCGGAVPSWQTPTDGITANMPYDILNRAASYNNGFLCGCGNAPVWWFGPVSGC